MRRAILPVLAVGAGIAALALSFGADASGGPGLLAYEDPSVVERGRVLYSDHCSACHGTALEGQANWRERDSDGYLPAPPHDETGHTWHHPDALLFEITKHGTEAVVGGGYRSNMAGFAEILSDDEIVAVLSYIKSTWPRRVIETHNEINEAAAQ